MEFIFLEFGQLVMGAGLMILTIAISAWHRLGLEYQLALATGRASLQLLLMAYGLAIVFSFQSPWLIVGALSLMVTVAAITAKNRVGKNIPQMLPLMGIGIGFSTVLTLCYVAWLVVQPQPWYSPRYLVPLAGIVIGNSMNAGAIAGERLATTIGQHHLEIETHLSLGATPQQAIANYRKQAIKTGLMPMINSMMVVGLVTLPGIMSGQMLGGIDPLQASAYQILIMFMLTFADMVTVVLVTWGLGEQFFNAAYQLKLIKHS